MAYTSKVVAIMVLLAMFTAIAQSQQNDCQCSRSPRRFELQISSGDAENYNDRYYFSLCNNCDKSNYVKDTIKNPDDISAVVSCCNSCCKKGSRRAFQSRAFGNQYINDDDYLNARVYRQIADRR